MSYVASAEKLDDITALQGMEHELNKQPWLTLQKLQSQVNDYDNMSAEYKLWWLLRKAQAENLSFLFDEFKQTVADAHQLINQQTSAQLISQFSIFSGIVNQREGNYQKAQKLLRLAQTIAENNNFTRIAVHARQELAYTRSLTELYELSLSDLQQAYVEAFAMSDDYLLAKINEVYGAIYGYMNDFEKSIEYYQKALSSYQQLEYLSDIAEATNGMAASYRYWGKYDLAIDYYHRFEKAIAFSPLNIDGKFYAAYGLGMSQAEKGDCEQALESINNALTFNSFIDYKAELYKRKAQCLMKAKQLTQAEQSLDQAAAIFANIPELIGTRWQLEVIKIRAELAHISEDNKKAYQLLKDYNEKQVALITKKASDRLLRVRGAFEHDRQNVEISLLQQRTMVQKLRFDQQKQENTFQTYIITIITVFILIVLFFVFYLRQQNKKLLVLSIKDPLSELYNRRYVFNFLDKFVDTTHHEKTQVAIMLIDIDDFKDVNDHYGHPFGDYVIREIAKIGRETLRVDDIMGRVGGEEFLCVLPRIDAIQCMQIAERLVKNVSSHHFLLEQANGTKQAIHITVSVGIATMSPTITHSKELYAQADQALYQAKHNGKNCAVNYSYM